MRSGYKLVQNDLIVVRDIGKEISEAQPLEIRLSLFCVLSF